MRKFAKTLTLGVAAAIMVAASTASYAAGCPRGSNGYYGANYYGGNNGYYEGNHNYGYYKKSYKKKNYYKKYEKYDYKKSTPPSDENNAGDDQVENNNAADDTAADNTSADNTAAEVSTQSQIFEIADKSECKVEGCAKLVLRDANGNEVVVSGIEFAAELADEASADELAYHLSENGNAVRGRLTPGDDDTYTFVIEKIYS